MVVMNQGLWQGNCNADSLLGFLLLLKKKINRKKKILLALETLIVILIMKAVIETCKDVKSSPEQARVNR